MKIKKFNEHLVKKTLVISAFPGCGKSHFFRNNKDKEVLDSDSSKFDKAHFPKNYIEHIKSNLGKVDRWMWLSKV
jgi:spore cortex formation protein SpoVR/YcgB (stage V sporulation)